MTTATRKARSRAPQPQAVEAPTETPTKEQKTKNIRPITPIRKELPASAHPGAKGGKWIEILTPIMKDQDEWHQFAEATSPASASALASQLRRGAVKRPAGGWIFASRQNEVYAKYLGEDKASPKARTNKRKNTQAAQADEQKAS